MKNRENVLYIKTLESKMTAKASFPLSKCALKADVALVMEVAIHNWWGRSGDEPSGLAWRDRPTPLSTSALYGTDMWMEERLSSWRKVWRTFGGGYALFFLSEVVSMLPHAVALNMLFKILMAELIPILVSFFFWVNICNGTLWSHWNSALSWVMSQRLVHHLLGLL